MLNPLNNASFLAAKNNLLCYCRQKSNYLFLTKHRTTQRASWSDRSASSKTSLLDPRTRILTVRPGLAMPVTLTTLLVPRGTSSTSSADAIISGVKWSKLAIGLHPKLWDEKARQNKQLFKIKGAQPHSSELFWTDMYEMTLKEIVINHKGTRRLGMTKIGKDYKWRTSKIKV